MSVGVERTSRPGEGPGAWSPEEMFDAFRSLGGIVDNLRLGEGEVGRGLFVIDPDQPAVLEVPPNLLAPMKDVRFEGERLTIAEDSITGPPEREFIARYHASYSYGGGGRDDCAAFVRRLDALPENIKEMLRRDFGFGALLASGDFEARVQSRFLHSRVITRNGELVLMPMVELLNHQTDAARYQISEGGVRVEGRFADEMRVAYSQIIDPFDVFFTWGFPHDELAAFSLPVAVDQPTFKLRVGRDLNSNEKISGFPAPAYKREGDVVTISHLKIGSERAPLVPRGMFHFIMRKLTGNQHDELFDFIAHYNRMKFLDLLEACEGREEGVCAELRAVCIKQLRAMSFAIGARPLSEPLA